LALAWQARLALPQVRVETLSDANYELVARFERTGASVTLLLADLGFGVPTFLACLTHDVPTAPARVFAAGTDLDPETGVRRSLEMLAHTLQYAQLLHSQMPAPEPDPLHRNVIDQGSHLKFWCDPANAAQADFLFASRERIELDEIDSRSAGDPVQDLLGLLRRLDAAGHRALLADATTPEVAELGLRVLRAVVPGLQPLFYGFHQRALGGSRLRGRLGGAADNPLPHPFPRKGVLA
jgi:ribosomal protein S12 methylthiotransferase accessory factor